MSLDDVDSLISQLGIDVSRMQSGAPAPPVVAAAPQPPPPQPPQAAGPPQPPVAEVDALLTQLGLTDAAGGGGAVAVADDDDAPPALRPVDDAPPALRPVAPSSGPGAMAGRGMMSSGPGAMAGRGMMSSGPGAMAGRGGFVSSGPGAMAGRGMMSSGPGAMAGRGMMSSGPGAMAGRGMMSSGPGAMAGRGMMSSGPGAMAGRGMMSSGPGAMALPGGVSSGPGAQEIRPAQFTPEGQRLTFSGPPCAVCGKEVLGRVLSACGKKYHPECFACEHCHRHILDTEPFAEEDGKPYCPDCFDELFGEKCYACGRPVTDQCIRFNGRIYHPNHFCCKGCGISLLTREYKEDEGEPYCIKCKNIQVRIRATKNDICAKCHKPILGEYIILNGQKIHPEHYRCEACGIDFQGGNCREHDGKNYCLDCYAKIVKSVCAKCNKPIIGRSITALMRVWHPECLACSVCGQSFASGKYFEHENQPYCEFHYYKLFGKICPRCQKVVTGEGVHAIGQLFHPECFLCSGCNKPLKGNVYDYESKPLCKSCFSKLPKVIRDAIEKKLEAEKKMQKEKEKAEKEAARARAAGKT